jgi:hypothetical protein
VLRQQHPHARIVTADASFFFMMMVKRFVVPSATAICLDANASLPFKADQFELAASADGWHYLDAQALCRHELMRVKRPEANLAMLHVHNRAVSNYTPGRPFALDEIMRLLRQIHSGPAVALNERAVAARAWSQHWPFVHVAEPHSQEFDLWIGELPREIHRANAGSSSALGKWTLRSIRHASRLGGLTGSADVTEVGTGQLLPTVTGFAARQAIAALRKHNIATAPLLRRAGLSEHDFARRDSSPYTTVYRQSGRLSSLTPRRRWPTAHSGFI